MNDQLESDLRAALHDRAAHVPSASVGRLTGIDYRPRTRGLRPPVAIGALASAGAAAGTLAVVISLGAGASNAFAGWTATPTAAGARPDRRRAGQLPGLAVADRRAAAQARRHARSVHVLDLRRRELERHVHAGSVVHRRVGQHVELPGKRSGRAHPALELARHRPRRRRVLAGRGPDGVGRDRRDAHPRRRVGRPGDGGQRLVHRLVAGLARHQVRAAHHPERCDHPDLRHEPAACARWRRLGLEGLPEQRQHERVWPRRRPGRGHGEVQSFGSSQ